MRYEEVMAGLNKQQAEAVRTLDGPLLVLAGPGTGKTQLLSVRVAHILQKTDTLASQILCLTFTESGVRAMRERLSSIIGDAAYEVRISTYHAFGRELLNANPQYADLRADAKAIDELAADQILRSIISELPFRHPLKQAEWYIGDVRQLISEAKRAAKSPRDIAEIARNNLQLISDTAEAIGQIFNDMKVVSKKQVNRFEQAVALLSTDHHELAKIAAAELTEALAIASDSSSTKPLTAWKNRWLEKDENNNFRLSGLNCNERLAGMADIYNQYQQRLDKEGYFDYDDMILKAIAALSQHPDFLYNQQEQYQYFLLDEFQDTNGSQLKLIELLTNNPVNEQRPNIMAVGDDDQAIFAFQGANYSNMKQFLEMYRDVKVISLETNYRSHPKLIELSHRIAEKVENRLHKQIEGVDKILHAAAPGSEGFTSQLHEFGSAAAHYQWIADKIASLIKSGTHANDIAILAPQHKYLTPLVPLLRSHNIAVNYEKRQNIFEEPIIQLLFNSAKLILALADDDQLAANAWWPVILSQPIHQLKPAIIWQLSWAARQTHEPWLNIIMNDANLKLIGEHYYHLAQASKTDTMENIIDQLIGTPEIDSPIYNYYFGQWPAQQAGLEYWQALSALKVLRRRLREFLNRQDQALKLVDFVNLIEAYQTAGIGLTNTSPLVEGREAVQLMTAYKSKGLEFEHVFVIAANDEVWGAKANGQNRAISLPPNLEYIRYAGATNDERTRLLYVALTRAKRHLYVTAYAQDDDGNSLTPLRYLLGDELPISRSPGPNITPKKLTAALAADWSSLHHSAITAPGVKQLLAEHLTHLRLNASLVNHFTDVAHAGPQAVLLNSILRFPQAPSAATEFGNAIHALLNQVAQLPQLPQANQLQKIWRKVSANQPMTDNQRTLYDERCQAILQQIISQPLILLPPHARHEVSVRTDNFAGQSLKAFGKLDFVEIDETSKKLIIADYKTGLKTFDSWKTSGPEAIKAHQYRQQLMFYKLLLDSAPAFNKYSVETGRIIFLEAKDGVQFLDMVFDEAELQRYTQLAMVVWQHIQQLSFPDVSSYPQSIKGIRQFEDDLITGQI